MVDCLFYFSFVLHFFRFIHFRIYIVQDCEHITRDRKSGSAGIVPDYDRYITSFNRSFHPQEGDVFWIDTVPQVDALGNLVLEDGIPTTPPDYRLKKILDTQRGNLARYGIKKIGAEE